MKLRCAVALIGMLAATAASAQAPSAPAAPKPAAQPMQPVASAPSEALGRMFFTPGERARLDELRHRPPQPPAEVAKPESPPPSSAPRYVTVDGVVRRSDGGSTVWLNNKPVHGQRAQDGLMVAPARGQPPSHVTVRDPETGRSIDVKVGQQLEINSGAVQEAYRPAREPAPLGQPERLNAEESAPAPTRRTTREREFVRELLRELEAESAAAAGPNRQNAAPGSQSGGLR
jgi:hypothetical protein